MTSPAGPPTRASPVRGDTQHVRQLRRPRYAAFPPLDRGGLGPVGARPVRARGEGAEACPAGDRRVVVPRVRGHGPYTTYSVPDIVSAINARCVPVRVDADRRPDINDRYNLDGWPTTAFLTPSGEMLSGSTYVVPDQMMRMLAEVCDGLAARYDELMARADAAAQARRLAQSAARYEPDPAAPDWLVEQILAQHDPEFGGFGADGKFLNAAPLRLALARVELTRDERLEALLTRTFDAMAWGGIFDEVDGGFFRYAAAREWSRPHTEKMLEDQAAMVGLLIDASIVFERASWRERARDVMRYVQRTLADTGRGGFYASQRADEEFYAVNASIRETLEPPVVDRTLFTDLNAQAAVTWLRAGEALEDVEAARFAVQSLERVLLAAYRPGEGVAHYHDASGEVRGLLSDQVHAAWALLHVHDATGDETYLMLAEELARTALRTHWDAREGGFLDHVGRRSRRHRPAPRSGEAAGAQLPGRPRACTARHADRARGTASARARHARLTDGGLPVARHRRRAVRACHHGCSRGAVSSPGDGRRAAGDDCASAASGARAVASERPACPPDCWIRRPPPAARRPSEEC